MKALSLAMALVLLAGMSINPAEAKRNRGCDDRDFGRVFRGDRWASNRFGGWDGRRDWRCGNGRGNRAFGHPVHGFRHPGHGAFHPVYGIGGKRNTLTNSWRNWF